MQLLCSCERELIIVGYYARSTNNLRMKRKIFTTIDSRICDVHPSNFVLAILKDELIYISYEKSYNVPFKYEQQSIEAQYDTVVPPYDMLLCYVTEVEVSKLEAD